MSRAVRSSDSTVAAALTAPLGVLLAALTGAVLAACGANVPSSEAGNLASPSRDATASGGAGASQSAAPSGVAQVMSWERLDDAPFARLEMATAAHDGRIWLAGGLSPFGEALSEVDVFDPATGTWADGPSLPAAVHHAALVSDGDRLLLIGGYLGSTFEQPTDVVLVLRNGDDTWQPGPALPAERAAGAAAWDGSRVLYAGGVGLGVVSDVYALEGDAWSRVGGLARPREHLAAASDGAGRTWFLGGRVGDLATNLGSVDVVEGTTIRSLDPLPTPRGGVAAFHLPEVGACVTGGEAPDRAYVTVECVAADGTVVALPDLATPHHGHGAAVVDGTAYVVLGGPEPTLSAGSVVERLVVEPG